MNAVSHAMLHCAKRSAVLSVICALSAAFALLSLPASADDDLPGRVGRVAELAGDLFIAPADKPDLWAAIGQNYPITSGDNLWVGNDGRAEIDFGGGQFRLAPSSETHGRSNPGRISKAA